EQPDAGIDRLIDQPSLRAAPHQHRAGATVALGTTLLAADESLGQPQMVQQRVRRPDVGQPPLMVVQQEAYLVADGHAVSLRVLQPISMAEPQSTRGGRSSGRRQSPSQAWQSRAGSRLAEGARGDYAAWETVE